MGVELSRSFSALKVWFTLKEHETIKLVSLLSKHEDIIRILRPVSLNIVNFRFEPEQLDKNAGELLDKFNDQLYKDIEKCGIAFPRITRIRNRIDIRVCIVSHRTIYQDFHLFPDTLLHLYQI